MDKVLEKLSVMTGLVERLGNELSADVGPKVADEVGVLAGEIHKTEHAVKEGVGREEIIEHFRTLKNAVNFLKETFAPLGREELLRVVEELEHQVSAIEDALSMNTPR